MKQYNYILFDWDGCIARTLDIWLEAYKKIFAQYDIYPTDKQITYEVFGDWKGCQKFGIEDDKTFGSKLIKEIEEKYPYVELYPHVKEAITKIKNKNKKLALITSSEKRIVQKALENNNLDKAFDSIIFGDEIAKHKPDPESLIKALDELHGIMDQAVIIGDSKSDLGAATNASIDSILFHPEHNKLFYELSVLKIYNPTFVIQDFKELDKIIV